MKHAFALVALLFWGHTALQAQTVHPDSSRSIRPQDLVGDWKTEITPPGNSPFVFEFGITMPSDSLIISSSVDGSLLTMEKVVLQENRLLFVMPMHGSGISCRLTHRGSGMMSGVCVGPMGESVTTMTRVASNQ